MTLDIIDNANSATVTTGGTTAPVAGTSEGWTVNTASPWSVLGAGEVMRVMDKADRGKTSGFEIMEVTANANGIGASWTVTRGAELTGGASAPYEHAPDWTVIPVLTPGGLDGRYAQIGGSALPGDTLLISAVQPGSFFYVYNFGNGPGPPFNVLDPTNLTYPFTVPPSGNVIVRLTVPWEQANSLANPSTLTFGFTDHTTNAVIVQQEVDRRFDTGVNDAWSSTATVTLAVEGLTPGDSLQWDLYAWSTGTENPQGYQICNPGGIIVAEFVAA